MSIYSIETFVCLHLVDHDIAVAEFKELVNDLSAAGLKVNVQPGPEKSLVVLVKSPYDLLSTFVFKSRYDPKSSPRSLLTQRIELKTGSTA